MSSANARQSDVDLEGSYIVRPAHPFYLSLAWTDTSFDLQIDPSHHIVSWVMSNNPSTALGRGKPTSLVDITLPKELDVTSGLPNSGPVRPRFRL